MKSLIEADISPSAAEMLNRRPASEWLIKLRHTRAYV